MRSCLHSHRIRLWLMLRKRRMVFLRCLRLLARKLEGQKVETSNADEKKRQHFFVDKESKVFDTRDDNILSKSGR